MEDSRIDDLIEEVRNLTIEVQTLKQELRFRESNPPPLRPTSGVEERAARSNFKVGDRVQILNQFKKPAVWDNSKRWSEAEAKTATVTKVREGQIFFLTDNGVSTWRAPNNLKKLQQHEQLG
jgi:hypothetical protein